MHVQWLARGNDTVLGNTSDPREFFLTRECENVLISDVSKVLDLQRRAVADFEAWRRQGGTEKAIAGSKAGGQDGWWRQLYIPEHGRFEYPQERDLTLGEGDFCRCCTDAKEEYQKAEVGWSRDGSWVRMGGTKFNKGDFIMIEDETLRYTVPKKEPQEFKKKKKEFQWKLPQSRHSHAVYLAAPEYHPPYLAMRTAWDLGDACGRLREALLFEKVEVEEQSLLERAVCPKTEIRQNSPEHPRTAQNSSIPRKLFGNSQTNQRKS